MTERAGFEAARLLNVDLDVELRDDPGPLLAALDGVAFALHAGPSATGWAVTLELSDPSPVGAEAVLVALLDAIDALPPEAARAWRSASRRNFSVGIQAGAGGGGFVEVVGADTLRRLAAHDASLDLTVYPPVAEGER